MALLTGCIDGDGSRPVVEEPMPPPAPAGDFAAFIACMTFDDFVSANMATAWSGIAAQNNFACRDCHGSQVEYSGDAQAFFDALKQRTFLQLKFFGFDGTHVVVNETTIPNVGRAQTPHQEHPRFNPQAGMAATRSLYDLTNTRIEAGNCP